MDFREILMSGTHVIIIPLPFTRSCILIAFSLVMETGRDSFLTGTSEDGFLVGTTVLESVVLGFTTLALGFVPNLTLDAGFANDPPNIDSYEPSEFGSSLFKEP